MLDYYIFELKKPVKELSENVTILKSYRYQSTSSRSCGKRPWIQGPQSTWCVVYVRIKRLL